MGFDNFTKLSKHKNIGFIFRLQQKMRGIWEYPFDKPGSYSTGKHDIFTDWNRFVKIICEDCKDHERNLARAEVDVIDMDTNKVIYKIDILKTEWYNRCAENGLKYLLGEDEKERKRRKDLENEYMNGDIEEWNDKTYWDEYRQVVGPNPKYLGREKIIKKVTLKRKPIKKTIKKCSCKKK